jgi:hypothetical protein
MNVIGLKTVAEKFDFFRHAVNGKVFLRSRSSLESAVVTHFEFRNVGERGNYKTSYGSAATSLLRSDSSRTRPRRKGETLLFRLFTVAHASSKSIGGACRSNGGKRCLRDILSQAAGVSLARKYADGVWEASSPLVHMHASFTNKTHRQFFRLCISSPCLVLNFDGRS